MKKIVFLGLLVHISAFGDINLKNHVIIENSKIKMGDFFEGLDTSLAQKEILYAPKPGQTLTLPYSWLKQLSHNAQLSWEPKMGDSITFERSGGISSKKDIESLVSRKMQEQGEIREFQISLSSTPIINIPSGDEVRIDLENVTKDGESEKFKATLKIFERDVFKSSYTVDGKFQLMTQIPTLASVKHVGEEIIESDLVWQKVPLSSINNLIITSRTQLLGFTPSHYPLRPGEFIKKHQIKQPTLISKGSEVSLVVERPGLILTSKGIALEDGMRGSVIRISNSSSKKVIQGVVRSSEIVEISMPSQSGILSQVSQ